MSDENDQAATEDLLPTPEAAALIGVPDAEFTRLAEALHLRPARPGSVTTARLWDRALIEQLRDGPEGQELREATARKARFSEAIVALERLYPEYTAALKPAATAMFQFNRWIKHATASRLRTQELYDLKNRFIELLYTLGLCKELLVHRVVLADEEDDEEPTQPREYLSFLFDIDGQKFEWHQPRRSVMFEYTLTERLDETPEETPRAGWQPRGAPKRVTLTPEEFFEAEALIRFVLRKRRDELAAQRETDKIARREKMRAEGLARQAELRRQSEQPEETRE